MSAVKVSPARIAAFEILRRIETEKAFSAHLLPLAEENLNPADRALCHALALGVLRRQLWLDAVVEHFSGKKIEKLDLAVRIALRLGLFQLRFLSKIPPSAAVNESVNLVHLAKKRSAVGFVNAILRRSGRETAFDPVEKIENPLEKLAVETSHPVWLLEKWQSAFGFDSAAALARANNQTPPTSFRWTRDADENLLEELRQAGGEIIASKIAPGAWRVSGATARLRELVAAGKIYLQDEASQLVAHAVDLQPGESFLDVCAAPGSKTTLINSKFKIQNSKFERLFAAGDISGIRIKILLETIAKFGSDDVKVVQYDAARGLPFADKSFDCVLIDAPCSGTGTIRHNPEIRFHLNEKDFPLLAARQTMILQNAARALKIGGRIVYSTCSLEPEENERVIREFLRENICFRQIKISLPERFLIPDGAARTFPQRDDADGFYLTALERTS